MCACVRTETFKRPRQPKGLLYELPALDFMGFEEDTFQCFND